MTLAALGAMDVVGRASRLRALLADADCDALLVTNLVDVRYLTGFSGSAALLLVTPSELVLATDGRYRDQAAAEVAASGADATVSIGNTGPAQREALVAAARGIARLGLQADHVSWSAQRRYQGEWFPDAELVAAGDLVGQLREVKDDGEIDRLAAAAAIADGALAEVAPLLADRPTEEAFALELDTAMRRRGSSGASFETIVASGPNGARPHARPTDRVVTEGDLVVIDFGAMVDGYHSDMTRTFVVGDPSPTQRRMLEVVTAAQQAGVDSVAPGVATGDVDAACRQVIDEAGWADAFLHATGHGVGLDIHEAPRVGQGGAATLRVGNVVTVEPGVYLPEHGGVRVEDTLVVTVDGWRRLTNAPKSPVLP